MKKSLPGFLTVAVVFSSVAALAASTNSQSYTNLGIFNYGSSSGEFVYYKTGTASANIKVTTCKFNTGCSTSSLSPTTQKQTYQIGAPFKDKNISFEGKTDAASTTVFGTLTQR